MNNLLLTLSEYTTANPARVGIGLIVFFALVYFLGKIIGTAIAHYKNRKEGL